MHQGLWRMVWLMLGLAIALDGCSVVPASGIGSPATTSSATSAPTASQTEPASSDPPIPTNIRDRAWAFSDMDQRIIGGPDLDHLRVITSGGESLITVVDGAALTTTNTNGKGPNSMRLRDLSSGAARWEIETPMTFHSAAVIGDQVLLAGTSQAFGDSGVSALDPASGGLVEVFPPQDLPDGGTGLASRTVIVSPTGRTAVTQLCAQNNVCATDTVDPSTGERTSVGQIPIRVRHVTDEVAIGAPDFPNLLAAFSLKTGTRVWRLGDIEVQWSYLTSDGRLVQSYIDHEDEFRYKVAILDPANGSAEVIFEAEVDIDRALWPTLSSDEHAVFGHGLINEVVGSDDPVASIIDLETGVVTVDAVHIEVLP